MKPSTPYLRLIAAAGIALASTLGVTISGAQNTPAEKSKADPVHTLQSIEDELRTKAEEEARLKKEAESRTQEIRKLRYRLIETANSIQDSEREIARIERELVRLTAEEKAAAAQLHSEQGNLSEVLAALQAFELSQPPALLVSPDDANRAARAALLLSEAAPALAEKAKELRTVVERLTVARTGLADQQEAYATTAKSLASRRQFLAEDLKVKERERDVADRLAAAAQRETAALAARATSLKGVVARLQEVAHTITPRRKPPRPAKPATTPDTPADNTPKGIEILTRSEGETSETLAIASAAGRGSITREDQTSVYQPAKSFREARGALRLPVVGRVTTKFGQRDELGDRFDGLRINVRDQAIVTAPFEAKVAFAQNWGQTGNMIVLDVGGGYHILLMGVGAFLVDAGQQVNAGEPLAEMSGNSAQLDLQIRHNGEPVNPAKWFSAKTVEEMAF